MLNTAVAREIARQHEIRLRRLGGNTGFPGRRGLRDWIGHGLVRTGTWLQGEGQMRTAPAGR